MAEENISLRKRQQISSLNKSMFLWVAIAAAVVGFAAVLAWFLVQQIWFGQAVLNEKNNTISVLKENNKNAASLADNIKALDANEDLAKLKAKDNDHAVQVILDALPADANSLALGASLQEKLIRNVSGVEIRSLVVSPVSGIESSDQAAVDQAQQPASPTGQNMIQFRLLVSAQDPNVFKKLLQEFERSIRTLDIDALTFERTDVAYMMSLTAHAYFEPAKTVELKDKEVKP